MSPIDQSPIDGPDDLSDPRSAVKRFDARVGALRALAAEPLSRHQRDMVIGLAERIGQAQAQTAASPEIGPGAGINSAANIRHGLAKDDRPIDEFLRGVVGDVTARDERFVASPLAYPAVMSVAALAIAVLVSLLIGPVFEEMFEEFGLTLPWLTQLLFSITRTVRSIIFGIWPLLILFAAVWLAKRYVWPWMKRWLIRRGYRFGGTTGGLLAMAGLAETTARALRAGEPIGVALRQAGDACDDPEYRDAAIGLAEQVESSDLLARDVFTIPTYGGSAVRFPANFHFALSRHAAGERSGVALLDGLAELYRHRAASRVESASGWLGIFGVVGLGIVVGLVVIALFAPLVSLVSALS
jgi:type IV pilus assembly protein PilC